MTKVSEEITLEQSKSIKLKPTLFNKSGKFY